MCGVVVKNDAVEISIVLSHSVNNLQQSHGKLDQLVKNSHHALVPCSRE